MPVVLVCPHCQTSLSVDDGFKGGVCRCSSCGTLLSVPADGAEAAAAARKERRQRPANPNADPSLHRQNQHELKQRTGVFPALTELIGSSSGLHGMKHLDAPVERKGDPSESALGLSPPSETLVDARGAARIGRDVPVESDPAATSEPVAEAPAVSENQPALEEIQGSVADVDAVPSAVLPSHLEVSATGGDDSAKKETPAKFGTSKPAAPAIAVVRAVGRRRNTALLWTAITLALLLFGVVVLLLYNYGFQTPEPHPSVKPPAVAPRVEEAPVPAPAPAPPESAPATMTAAPTSVPATEAAAPTSAPAPASEPAATAPAAAPPAPATSWW